MKKTILFLVLMFLVLVNAEAQRTVVDQDQTRDEAVDIPYDNSTSGLTGVNVQAALDELDAILDTITGGYVTSFNGRTGAVVPILGDYTTSIVAEGTNLYYTQARFDAAFTAKSTTDLSEGSNLYYTQARFDSAFSAKSTTDLTEGSNLYYTEARVSANSDVSQNTTHRGLTNNPHSVTASQVGAYTIAQTDTEISNAITAHEADSNPHPQYLTQPEGDALYYSITNPSGFETPAQLNARDIANRDRANHTNTQSIGTITETPATSNNDDLFIFKVNAGGTGYETFQPFETTATEEDCLINSTGTYAEFLELTDTFPTGNYLISVHYSWSYDDTGTDFVGRIQLDNTNLPRAVHVQEPKDVGGGGETCANFGGGTDNSGTNQIHWNHYQYTVALSGAHTIEIDFLSGGAGGIEATIYGASISVRRVLK